MISRYIGLKLRRLTIFDVSNSCKDQMFRKLLLLILNKSIVSVYYGTCTSGENCDFGETAFS